MPRSGYQNIKTTLSDEWNDRLHTVLSHKKILLLMYY